MYEPVWVGWCVCVRMCACVCMCVCVRVRVSQVFLCVWMCECCSEKERPEKGHHTHADRRGEGKIGASLPHRERLSHRNFLGIWGVSDEHFEHVVHSVEGKRLEIG